LQVDLQINHVKLAAVCKLGLLSRLAHHLRDCCCCCCCCTCATLLSLLLLQEVGGQVPARLVFRAQGLAEGWKDPSIRRAVLRGAWHSLPSWHVALQCLTRFVQCMLPLTMATGLSLASIPCDAIAALQEQSKMADDRVALA
jgi:hypothetical protein